MTKRIPPQLAMSETNVNPALRPSVDHLLHQLKESKVMNRDLDQSLFVIEFLIDWFLARPRTAAHVNGTPKDAVKYEQALRRLFVGVVTRWLHSITEPLPFKTAPWDGPIEIPDDLNVAPTIIPGIEEPGQALAEHQIDRIRETDGMVYCACGRTFPYVDKFNMHQRVQLRKLLRGEK